MEVKQIFTNQWLQVKNTPLKNLKYTFYAVITGVLFYLLFNIFKCYKRYFIFKVYNGLNYCCF